MANTNYTAKTFFGTMWPLSLQNIGINPDFNNLPALVLALENAFRDITPFYYGSICYKEPSKDGNAGGFHIHFSASFSQAKRMTAAAKLFGNAHLEPQRGTKSQAADYIEKKPPFEEKGEKVLAYFGSKDKMRDNSGSCLNVLEFDKLIRDGSINASNLPSYILEHAITEKEASEMSSRFRRVLASMASNWRNVKVIYVEGETGSGKTRGVYEQFSDIFKASVDSKTAFPFDGYLGQSVLVLDELRPGVFKPSELFQILDGYPLNVNVKGSNIPAMWDTVIISTAFPLSAWFVSSDDDTGNTDIMKAQFMRRIKVHKLAIDNTWIDYPSAIDNEEEKIENRYIFDQNWHEKFLHDDIIAMDAERASNEYYSD